ncbi:MAG: hypothetical protein V2I43_15140 [Parvularcula sp.]|jgi:hypothetical protein|nr:hypothetical protein [Parvularcula sp.]
MTDEEGIIFCAFRYAMGRSTYVVDEVANYIREHRVKLSDPTRALIVQEIREAVAKDRAGHHCDVGTWCKLADVLEGGGDDR